MSRYLNQVMGAKRRIELRERPEPDDVEIIRPMLADLVIGQMTPKKNPATRPGFSKSTNKLKEQNWYEENSTRSTRKRKF